MTIAIIYLVWVVVAFRFVKHIMLEDKKEFIKAMYWAAVKPRVIVASLFSWSIFPIAILIGVIRLIYKNL